MKHTLSKPATNRVESRFTFNNKKNKKSAIHYRNQMIDYLDEQEENIEEYRDQNLEDESNMPSEFRDNTANISFIGGRRNRRRFCKGDKSRWIDL